MPAAGGGTPAYPASGAAREDRHGAQAAKPLRSFGVGRTGQHKTDHRSRFAGAQGRHTHRQPHRLHHAHGAPAGCPGGHAAGRRFAGHGALRHGHHVGGDPGNDDRPRGRRGAGVANGLCHRRHAVRVLSGVAGRRVPLLRAGHGGDGRGRGQAGGRHRDGGDHRLPDQARTACRR